MKPFLGEDVSLGRFVSPPVLTTEALGGELVAGAVGVDHHHAGAVVPLQLQARGAADQVHVARVVDLESELLESRLGVAGVDVELRGGGRTESAFLEELLHPLGR